MRVSLLSRPTDTELSEEELAQVRGAIIRYAGGAGNENGVLIPPLQAGVFTSNGIKVWEAANWGAVHAWRCTIAIDVAGRAPLLVEEISPIGDQAAASYGRRREAEIRAKQAKIDDCK
jgi:hypothetical protein